MNQNWKQFGTNSARLSEGDMANRDHCKMLLTGAVAEYLDEEWTDEFIIDLTEILLNESERYIRKATAFRSCLELIHKGLKAIENEETEEEQE